MKNLTMKTKMIITFVILVILTSVNAIAGMTSVNRIKNSVSEMQEEEFTSIQNTMKEIGADEKKAKVVTDAIQVSKTEGMDDINRTANLSNYVSLAIVAVSVIVTIILALSLIKQIARSVRQLSDAAKRIALGHTDITLVKYANDEFGELVDEYTQVIENIKTQAMIAEEVAGGNLTVQVNPKSNEDMLGNALKKLAQGSTEQASAIQEITASINEIAEKTKGNAEQANEAAGLVVRAIDDVKQGNKQMHDTMAAMQDINKSSESISKIIKTIDDIAFQTNILALNAAVEAARAGEAGKGFAVVAEEVRSLAAKSAAASAETAELIEDSIEKVGSGSRIVDDTAKAMEEISRVVQESEKIINGIAESSNYQATAVAQIEQAITQVSQVVQTNSATSEQCAAASEELSNQAARMREMLAIYNLGNGSQSFSGGSSSASAGGGAATMSESIISFDDDFGKY